MKNLIRAVPQFDRTQCFAAVQRDGPMVSSHQRCNRKRILLMKRVSWSPPDASEMIMNILECHRSQTDLAYFHVSTVFTLKMHKNGLEKNSKHFQLMPTLSRGTLTQPETRGKVPVVVFYGLFFYSVRKLGSFVVLVLFFSTFFFQNLKYPTLTHWLARQVSSTSKTHIPCLPTTSQVPPVQFSLDSVALNFRPIWCHRPSLKHCALSLLDY